MPNGFSVPRIHDTWATDGQDQENGEEEEREFPRLILRGGGLLFRSPRAQGYFPPTALNLLGLES